MFASTWIVVLPIRRMILPKPLSLRNKITHLDDHDALPDPARKMFASTP